MASEAVSFFPDGLGSSFFGPVINVAWNVQNDSHSQLRGLDILRSRIARNAHYDADHEEGPTRCDEDTQVELLDKIIAWAKCRSSIKPILWLNGAAGVGKSSIAISVSEICDEDQLLLACFLFLRSDSERNSLEYFVCTIAYNIAVKIPKVRYDLDRIILHDPTILEKPLEVQWRKLVVGPLRSCPADSLPPMLIVLDGLDECENRLNPGREPDQPRLLHLIFQSYKCPLPIRFFITSRPEPQIANKFGDARFEHLLHPPISLRDTPQAREEMRRAISRRWEEIYQQHRHILPPASRYLRDDLIDWIVDNAEGQWVFPITIFRHLGQAGGDPRQTLSDVLRSSETRAAALVPLDQLYVVILASVPRQSQVLVQKTFMHLLSRHFTSSLPFLAEWWGINTISIRLALECLHSVLMIPTDDDDEEDIEFHHKSFRDFLTNPIRSSRTGFHLTEAMAHTHQARHCFRILGSDVIDSQNYWTTSWGWMGCCSLAPPDDPLLLEDLKSFDFEHWIQTWYVKQNWEVHQCSKYPEFLSWLDRMDSPPSQYYPNRPMQYLFSVTCDSRTTSIEYLRLLLVTEDAHELDWGGFRSLYYNHLSQEPDAPQICQHEPSVAQQLLDANFLCDKDRAHKFFVDILEAKEDFTLACLSCLVEGNCRTASDCQAYAYAKRHWMRALDEGFPTSPQILEFIWRLPHQFHGHASGCVYRWLKSFGSRPGIGRMISHWAPKSCPTSPSFQYDLWTYGPPLSTHPMTHSINQPS